MINLIMTGSMADLEKLTGLDRDGLWDVGFCLDDWDVCFVSDVPLHSKTIVEHFNSEFCGEYDTESYELNYNDAKYDDVHWLFNRMDSYCVGFNHVEFNGKHYYTVHHS